MSLPLGFYDVISYFSSVQVEKSTKLELFVFHMICLKFGIRGKFEMITTKKKLKLENYLSKKLQFSTDFSQNYTKHS